MCRATSLHGGFHHVERGLGEGRVERVGSAHVQPWCAEADGLGGEGPPSGPCHQNSGQSTPRVAALASTPSETLSRSRAQFEEDRGGHNSSLRRGMSTRPGRRRFVLIMGVGPAPAVPREEHLGIGACIAGVGRIEPRSASGAFQRLLLGAHGPFSEFVAGLFDGVAHETTAGQRSPINVVRPTRSAW